MKEGGHVTFAETGHAGNIGQNGTVLEAARVRQDGLTLRTKAGKEGFVPWERFHDESGRVQLAYGDALTTHTAQGSTVTEHIHAMPSGSRLVTAFGAYTSGSRHREQSFIMTSEGAERAEISGRRPLGDRREIAPSDVLANVTLNLSRQDEKESAVSLIERAVDLRRGTIRTVQAAFQRMEERKAARNTVNYLPERLEHRRIIRVFERRLPGLVEQLRRHGEQIGLMIRAGTALVERVTELTIAKRTMRMTEGGYWQRLAQRASKVPEQTEVLGQTRKRKLSL